jgi:phosphoglycerate-specific signal transduction histidine kinase
MRKNPVKLGTKLGLAFLVLVLLTVAVGGFALSQLSGMNARTQELADNWLPSVKALGEVHAAANQLRFQEADHIISGDATEMAQLENQIYQGMAAFFDRQQAYENLISSAQERSGYKDFKNHRDSYLALQNRLIELSRGGEGH